MKKTIKGILIFFASLFVGIFAIIVAVNAFYFLTCRSAVSRLPEITMDEYLRLKLYGNTYIQNENTVSGTLAIMNTNGNEIATFERSWSGSYLQMEFIQVSMDNKTYFFPSVIYGKNHIYENRQSSKRVTSLEKYFNDNQLCLLLGNGSTLEEKKDLYKISRFASNKNIFFGFKYKKTIVLDLSDCQTGKYYSIMCNNKGKLVVIEM